jgi:hypothetical protein
LFALQLLFWEILKFSSTFHYLNQSSRATLKNFCVSARSGRDVTPSAFPPGRHTFGLTTMPVGPGSRAGTLPSPDQVALRLRAGQVATPRPPCCTGVHAPWPRCMRITWLSSGPRRGAPSPGVRHAPLTPSHTRPSGQRPSAAVHAPRRAAIAPRCVNSPLEPSPRAPSSSTRTHAPTEPSPEHTLHREAPARRSRCSSGWRSAPLPNSTADHSSNPSNPRNGTLSEEGPLPRPFPAKSALLFTGIQPSSSLATPGPDCNLSSRSKDLSARGKDLFVKLVFQI